MQRRIIIGIAAGLAMYGAWWLASPLVLDRTLSDPPPGLELTDAERDVLARIEALTPEQIDRLPAAQREKIIRSYEQLQEKMPVVRMREPAPGEGTEILATGSLRDGDAFHKGAGDASILRLADGALVLRLEKLHVTNGPALHAYLTVDEDGATDRGYVDLGPLKGNKGDQNYDIPAEVEISQYNGLAIWCVPFGVQFATATL